MRRFALMLCVVASPVAADWVSLKGDAVRVALEGRVVEYENARQDFRASGRTLYTFGGRDSWGYRRVQGDQYCSQWPPSDLWACYDLEQNGIRVRFVGSAGADDVTVGIYVD